MRWLWQRREYPATPDSAALVEAQRARQEAERQLEALQSSDLLRTHSELVKYAQRANRRNHYKDIVNGALGVHR